MRENDDSRAATKDARGASENGSFLNGEKNCGGVANRSSRTDTDRAFLSADDEGIDLYPDDEDEPKERNP